MSPQPADQRSPTTMVVTCLDCAFRRDATTADGSYDTARMAGRRHAERQGHVVTAKLVHTLTWDGRRC